MIDRASFYALRDQRTVEYGVPRILGIPIGIAIGQDAAETRSGQLCALALVNMLARVYHSLRILVPEVPLLVPADAKASTLDEACREIILRIDPFNDVRVQSVDSVGFLPSGRSVGLGCAVPPTALCIGASGFLGEIGPDRIAFSDYGGFYIGSGVAACLGAAGALRLAAGNAVMARRVSFWDFTDGAAATTGPPLSVGPIDVGHVWMVGAGAVGSAVAYWLGFPGVRGPWTIIDKDHVELHNTNRSLCLFPEDAGWPAGTAVEKAPLVAARIGAESVVDEYCHWAAGYRGRLPDLVLPLANDNGARHAISALGQPLLLHAATGQSWESHLHRHVAGLDDCIDCRLPEPDTVRLKCSEGSLPSIAEEASSDAALPFLSGAAGLMLVSALVQIEQTAFAGHFLEGRLNRWSLLLDLTQGRSWQESVCGCSEGCRSVPEQNVRRELHGESRWRFLDSAHS